MTSRGRMLPALSTAAIIGALRVARPVRIAMYSRPSSNAPTNSAAFARQYPAAARMTDQLPAAIRSSAVTIATDTLYSAGADRRSRRRRRLALRRILHRQRQQRPHPPGLCPGLWPVLRLVRAARPHVRRHPTIRRGRLGEGIAGETRGAGGEAAARRRADAV